MQTLCCFDRDLHRHLTAQDALSAIDAEIEGMLSPGADFYPLTPGNLVEALDGISSEALVSKLVSALRRGRFEEAGGTLHTLAYAYFEQRAEEYLEDQRTLAECADFDGV